MRRAALFTALLSVLAAFSAGLSLTPMWVVHGQSGPATYTRDLYASYQFHTLKYPTGLAIYWDGFYDPPALWHVFIADTSNDVIRQLYNGSLTTVAGTGVSGYVNGQGYQAQFTRPTGLTLTHDLPPISAQWIIRH